MRECSSYIHLYVQMGYKNSLGAKCQHCVFGLGVEGDGFFILNKDCVLTGRWEKKKKKKEEETCFKCMACNVCCSASLQLQHLLFQVERKNIQALECVKKKKKKVQREGSYLHRRCFLEWRVEGCLQQQCLHLGKPLSSVCPERDCRQYEFMEFVNAYL